MGKMIANFDWRIWAENYPLSVELHEEMDPVLFPERIVFERANQQISMTRQELLQALVQIEIAELNKVEAHLNSQAVGKFTREQALALIPTTVSLELYEKLYALVEEEYEKNSFAGYARLDGIISRIQLMTIRLKKEAGF